MFQENILQTSIRIAPVKHKFYINPNLSLDKKTYIIPEGIFNFDYKYFIPIGMNRKHKNIIPKGLNIYRIIRDEKHKIPLGMIHIQWLAYKKYIHKKILQVQFRDFF